MTPGAHKQRRQATHWKQIYGQGCWTGAAALYVRDTAERHHGLKTGLWVPRVLVQQRGGPGF